MWLFHVCLEELSTVTVSGRNVDKIASVPPVMAALSSRRVHAVGGFFGMQSGAHGNF